MIAMWMGAALRSLALALAVWAVLRAFRVRNVLALKSAWVLVLMAAFVAPLAIHWPLATVVLPVSAPPAAAAAAPASMATHPSRTAVAPRAAVPEPSPFKAPGNVPPESATPGSAPQNRAMPHTGGFSLLPAPQAPLTPALPPRPASYSFAEIAAAFYFAVTAALLFRLGYGLFSALRLWCSAKPVSARIDALGEGLRLRASAAVSSPVTVGSAVLLPPAHCEWAEEKLRVILAHERSHIRQGDFYLQVLAGLYAALIWFSPLGWWLKRQLSELGEAISDRSGLKEAASRSAYAQILLEFAAAPRPTQIGVAMARSSDLSQRIERLFDDRAFRQAFSLNRRTVFAAVLVTAAMFAATTLVRVEAATQTAPPASDAASAAQAASPATTRQIVIPPVHVNVPPIHVNVPEHRIDIPAVHVNVPAIHVNVPAVHVNVPGHAVNVPAQSINVPAQTVDVPAQHIDVPAQDINVPAQHIDVPGQHIDIPAIHLDEPAAGTPDNSGGRASLGSAGEMLAMLHFPRPPMLVRVSDQSEATFERTLTFTGTAALHVKNGSGNIHLTHGTDGQVRVFARVHSSRAGDEELVRSIATHPPIEQNGNTIEIGGNLHRHGMNHISIDYEIAAPADTALTVATGSGNVRDEGVGPDAKLNTGSGDVVVSGMPGAFKVETGSGNIGVENTAAGEARLQTGSGDIEVRGIRGGLWAETGSGDVKAEGAPASQWKLATGSGDIDLALGSAAITLDASTGTGDITSERAMTTQVSSDRHHLHAELNGGGVAVHVETGSGDIRIR